jgi:hypothetical protein
VSFLSLIRVLTVVVALVYGIAYLPVDWLELHFRHTSIIGETGISPVLTAGQVGIYITVPLSLVLVFALIPRWHAGVRALSWCFFVMGICVLTHLVELGWLHSLSFFTQFSSGAQTLCFSLPAFILAAVLRHPAIYRMFTSNQSLEATATRSETHLR